MSLNNINHVCSIGTLCHTSQFIKKNNNTLLLLKNKRKITTVLCQI